MGIATKRLGNVQLLFFVAAKYRRRCRSDNGREWERAVE